MEQGQSSLQGKCMSVVHWEYLRHPPMRSYSRKDLSNPLPRLLLFLLLQHHHPKKIYPSKVSNYRLTMCDDLLNDNNEKQCSPNKILLVVFFGY